MYIIVNYSLILSFNLRTIYFILDFQCILLLLLFYDFFFVSFSANRALPAARGQRLIKGGSVSAGFSPSALGA
jgi:hypothetical protein